MDAVKFVKEYLRMCAKFSCCEECPAFMTEFCAENAEEQSPESAEKIVALIEEWSAAHPCKTRQSVFLEQYPEAEIGKHGSLMLCPKRISADCRDRYGSCTSRLCYDCLREFWMQEVE